MSKREHFLLIQDMLESIQKIKSYTLGMTWEDFQNNDKTIDAVIRNFEIIGEVADRVPDDIKDRNEQINWHFFENRLKELQEQLEDV